VSPWRKLRTTPMSASYRTMLIRQLSSRMMSTAAKRGASPAGWPLRHSNTHSAKWALAPAVAAGVVGFGLAAGEAQCESRSSKQLESDENHHKRAMIIDDIFVDHEWDASRYGGYAFLIGRIAKSTRYLAYSSDVGEAFRPVVPAFAVNATYALALGYCTFDVGYEGYKESKAGGEVSRTLIKQTLFQGLASIGLPFLIIHTAVHTTQKACKQYAPKALKWGPTIVGLVIIPFLPAVCDEPVEHAIEYGFDEVWPRKDGKKGHAH